MSIASAIENAQTKVAACYTSVDTMGGTLPETQNLSNLSAAIESIPQGGGGGTTVLAYDTTGLIWPDDDDKKVLVNYGQDNVVKSEEFTTTPGRTNDRNYIKPVWFDNDTFSIFSMYSPSCYKYNYNGVSWERAVVTAPFTNAGYYTDFRICDKGMLATNISASDNSHDYRCYRIVDSGGNSSTISGVNNVHCYGATIDGNMIYSGDITGYTTFAIWLGTTQVTRGSKYFLMHVDVENNKLLYMAGSTPHIVNFTGTTVNSDTASDISINVWCVCCTGLNEGDYVVVMPKNTTSSYNYCPMNSATILGQSATTYQVYRIDSNNKLIAANEDDILATYTSLTKSIWHWDSRNNLLTIGTTDNVYVLEWNSSTKTWTKVLSDFPLPTNTTGSIYNATISPSRTRMVVYVGDMSTQNQNIFIYDINVNEHTWTIVKNVIPNYDSILAFTGTFQGKVYNVETQEYYSLVNVALPEEAIIECSLTSDYEPELSIL